MRKIAVYGSLLSGLGNHGILARGLANNQAALLGEDTISIPYGMISYGGFPALVPSSSKQDIKIEVYEVDDEVYQRVERLEGYPHFYQKYKVTTKYGEAEIYVINNEAPFEAQPYNIKVDDGNWRNWRILKTKHALYD